MLTDPELNEIVNGERGMLRGIDACIETRCLVSAIALIFSAMDSLAALARPVDHDESNSADFQDWVSKYVEPEERLGCTGKDLWAARCGVLHTYGYESRDIRQGRAQAIIYKWQHGPRPKAVQVPSDAKTLVVENLRSALSSAAARFLDDSQVDTALKARVEHHKRRLLCYKPWSTVVVNVAA